MGYDFYAYHRLKDEEYLFTTACMYAYEPIFKKCANNERGINYFHGRVTKKKINEFKEFIDRLEADNSNNLDCRQMRGYMGNITYEKLINDFKKIYELMKSGECKYFYVG
ncbi:hypothetical protein ACSW9O_15360 (plasmid) [Clostridium perfringens]|nr:hypothetical protein [Clostridium perfringens]